MDSPLIQSEVATQSHPGCVLFRVRPGNVIKVPESSVFYFDLFRLRMTQRHIAVSTNDRALGWWITVNLGLQNLCQKTDRLVQPYRV